MRFSTIIVTLALSVGLAVAGPVVDRDDDISVTGTSDGLPKYGDSDVDGGDDSSPPGRRGVTMRGDINPLDARDGRHGRDFAILIVCKFDHCHGPCWGYNLDHVRYNKCFNVYKYRSVYIYSDREHHDDKGHHHRDHHDDKGDHHDEEYGVYVAKHRRCKRNALIPTTNRCFNVKPYADEFFKWKKDHHDDDKHHHDDDKHHHY